VDNLKKFSRNLKLSYTAHTPLNLKGIHAEKEMEKYWELILNYYWIGSREQTCNISMAHQRRGTSPEHSLTSWIQRCRPIFCPLNSTSIMPPRKAAAADDTDPPRRSGRIASQPVTETKPKAKAKVTKKRAAVDEAKDSEGGSSAKKVLKLFFLFFLGRILHNTLI
jgi:hypothetical protein